MKNKILSIVLCFVFCIILSFQSFAISPYGSVSPNTSQVQILYAYMQNDVAFDPMMEFLIMRTGEYEYTAFFNIDGNECSRIRYIGHRDQGYTTYWYFDRDDIDDFNYSSNNYTVVGNRYESLAISQFEDFKFQLIITTTSFITMFSVLLFVFRVHKRGMAI